MNLIFYLLRRSRAIVCWRKGHVPCVLQFDGMSWCVRCDKTLNH